MDASTDFVGQLSADPNNQLSRSRRVVRWMALVVVVVCTVALIGGIPVYVRPQVDTLRKADAVFVLGGPPESRFQWGLDLGRQGWAPAVVLSGPVPSQWLKWYCDKTPHRGIDLHCFIPDPPTTRGEARELRRLAKEHDWRSVIVVTVRPHISRARYILEQCFSGELIMIECPDEMSFGDWSWQYLYQTAGYLRTLAAPDC